jgi:energy-coupling factor transport system permease protein
MRFDVGEKLSATLFCILLSVALPWRLNAALFVFLLLVRFSFKSFRPASAVSRRRFRVLARYFVLVVLLMTVINGLLIKGGTVWPLPGGFSLSGEGVEFGLRTGMRLLVIATSLLLFFGSTPIPRLARFLQSVGWPTQLVMTLLLTLYFIETLPERISLIFTAQEARGAPVRANILARTKGFFLILSPLLLSAIVESIDRSMALELRGFHSGSKLSFSDNEADEARLSIISLSFLVLSSLCILWIILQWLLP